MFFNYFLICHLYQVEHVVVCGHSDCKAINLLYSLSSDPDTRDSAVAKGPLSSWITRHGASTMQEFEKVPFYILRVTSQFDNCSNGCGKLLDGSKSFVSSI